MYTLCHKHSEYQHTASMQVYKKERSVNLTSFHTEETQEPQV